MGDNTNTPTRTTSDASKTATSGAPPCMRVPDVAARWNCSATHVRTLIKQGKLPAISPGHILRIRVVDLEEYEAQCRTKSPASAASPDKTHEAAANAMLVTLIDTARFSKDSAVRVSAADRALDLLEGKPKQIVRKVAA